MLEDAPKSGRPPFPKEKKIEIVAEIINQYDSADVYSCGINSTSVQRVLKLLVPQMMLQTRRLNFVSG